MGDKTIKRGARVANLTLGEKIALLRNRKKLNKKQLAEATGMHWTSISKYERNEAEPYLDTLRKQAQTLGVSTDYLLFENSDIDDEIQDNDLHKIMCAADKLDDQMRNTLKNMVRSFLEGQ